MRADVTELTAWFALALLSGLVLAPTRALISRVRLFRASVVVAFLGITVGLVRLLLALISTDTSFAAVVDASRRNSSVWLRVAGLWGSARSSIWVWTWMSAAVICVHTVWGRRQDLAAWIGRVRAMSAVTAAFGCLGLVFARPFASLDFPPVDGLGLSPILEHPAMVIHPPIMYSGLVLTMLAWAYVVAAGAGMGTELFVSTEESVSVRRLLLVASLLIGVALLLGAVWAYDEQGWGGYWAWDPVENGGLLPWLAAITAVHTSLRKRVATMLHVTVVFALTCLGALATRSGVLPSVHGFAEQRALGWGLLLVVVFICIRTVYALVSHRRRTNTPTRLQVTGMSPRVIAPRVIARCLGVIAIAVITVGTYAPLVRYLVWGQRAQTLGVYFSRVGYPLAMLALAGLLFDALSAMAHRRMVIVANVVGALVGVGLVVLSNDASMRADALMLGGLAGAAVAGVVFRVGAVRAGAGRQGRSVERGIDEQLNDERQNDLQHNDEQGRGRHMWSYGSAVAHLGFALMLLGIGGSVLSTHRRLQLPPNATGRLGSITIRNDGVAVVESVGERRIVATFSVTENGAESTMRPALVGFDRRPVLLGETAIERGVLRDLYVSLQSATDAGATVVDVYYRPLMTFVWAGVLVLLLGLTLTLPRQQLLDR